MMRNRQTCWHNHLRQRTPRVRPARILRKWCAAAAAERYAWPIPIDPTKLRVTGGSLTDCLAQRDYESACRVRKLSKYVNMRILSVLLWMNALASVALAQGIVNFANNPSTLVSYQTYRTGLHLIS